MSRRVAIVGIGLVTSLGSTREDTWSRMLAGDCGVRDVTLFDTEGYRSRLAAEVGMDELDASQTAAWGEMFVLMFPGNGWCVVGE